MELGTGIHTGIISASQPPDGPAQGTRSPALYPGFPAVGTAKFLASGVTRPGNWGALLKFITDGFRVALNCVDATLDYQITVGLRASHHYRIIPVVLYGTRIPPVGQGTYAIWKYQP